MTIIGFGSHARVGKSTAGDILVADHGFKRVSFAAPLKQLAMLADPPVLAGGVVNVAAGRGRLANIVQMEGWDNAKAGYPEVRQFLQRLGVGARDVFGEDIWVDVAFDYVDRGSFQNYVFDDVRFRNEALAIVERAGHVVKIERPGCGPVNDHVSEHDLDDWEWDHVIRNDGTHEDLSYAIEKLLDRLTTKPKAA